MEKRMFEVLKNAPYFTKQNIGLALQKDGEDLNYWIKRLLAQKILISLKKGFCVSSYYQDMISQNPSDKEWYFIYLSNMLRFPSYVSLEYVLSRYNIIPEASFSVTSITTKSSRVYSSELTTFVYQNIKEELFFGYENERFKDKTVRMASKAKALFDLLYLRSFENKEMMTFYLFDLGRIDWDILTVKDKDEFVKTIVLSSSKKMQSITGLLKEKKIL